ncbi:MAG: TolC family protein, partial [Kofleriaceae bacterium]
VGTNRVTAQEVIGISVPLPILGTLGAARDEATAHATVVRDEGEVARRDLRHRAIAAWLELARADTQVATLVTAATQAAELERIAQGRLDAGVGGEVDVTSAHAARSRADVAVTAAKREGRARGAELAGILAWDPLRERHATGALPGGAEDLETLRRSLSLHPERAAALARIGEAEAVEHRISVAYRPVLAAEVSASFNDPTMTMDPFDVYAGLALDLPLFGHLGDHATAARHDTAAARARLAAVERALGAALVAAVERWQAARERMTGLETEVVPAQQKAARLAAQAFREGARDLATALQAARDQAAVDAELANARIDTAQAWIELALAAGKDERAR